MKTLTQENTFNNYPKCLYAKNEYFSLVYQTQQKMANLVCIDKQNEKICFYNIMQKLSQIAENRLYIDNSILENCKKQGNILDHQLAKNKTKNQLIKKVLAETDNLERTTMVFRSLTLNSNENTVNIDLVVITNSAIFVLELKNPKQNIHISETGDYYKINSTSEKKFDKNIYDDLCKKVAAIKKALSINQYSNLPIIPYLVFLNTDTEVINDCEYIQSCYINELVKVIDEDERESIIFYNQMQDIINQLKFQNKYLAQENDIYNLIELKNNFAELLMELNLSSESEIFQFLYGDNVAA